MKNNFVYNGLRISVERMKEELVLHICSDYSRSQHKGRLFVDSKRLADEIERFWKSIKTKKLQKLSVYFGEIDWYDDMTDVYETPIVYIQRGLKKAKTHADSHGSIPKDWSFEFNAVFADTNTNTPIMEVVKSCLGSFFTPALEKEFKKTLKPVLQKTKSYCFVETEY